MARIAGIDLPKNKRIEIGLTYIYGIGRSSANDILEAVTIDKDKKVNELDDKEVRKLRNEIEKNYTVEGALRAETQKDIKRLVEIGCYRGRRHRKGLPVRGQRTRTNAKTRKNHGR